MNLEKLLKRIRLVLSSPTTHYWIIALFVLQALLATFMIAPSTPKDGIGAGYSERNEDGVVPDGHRHLGAIYYYAERPILQGPVIADMAEEDLWMGDLVRFPSYFYYYVMSFPVRVAMAAGASDIAIIYLVRLLGVVMGTLALLVFRRIVQLVTSNVTIQNLSVLALSLTGSFVWLSAAENYDIPALLLWFLFLHASISLFVKKNGSYLYWMALWFFILSITKYTYIPFAAVAAIAALILYGKNQKTLSTRLFIGSIMRDCKAALAKLRGWVAVVAIVALVVSAGLFTERIVGNLVTYQSFNPSCKLIHSHEACMSFGVYARNYNHAKRLSEGTATIIEYVPVVGYPAYWVKRYFDSMYVYMGHIFIPLYSLMIELAGLVVGLIGIAGLVLARMKKIRLFKTQPELYVLGAAVMLTVVQFLFNLRTVVNYGGQTFAHQGRYLLPAVGLAYVLYLIALYRIYKKQNDKNKRRIVWVGIVVAAYAIIIASAIPSFLIHAISPNWYSEAAQTVLPEWVTNRQ